jgi:hypothetical protein
MRSLYKAFPAAETAGRACMITSDGGKPRPENKVMEGANIWKFLRFRKKD